MKIKSDSTLALVLLLLFLLAGIQKANSQNADSTTFAGSNLKSEDLASKTDVIFIGQVINIGMPDLSAAGAVLFSGNEIKVLQVLKGSVGVQQIMITFNVLEGAKEQIPKVGGSYIFFANKVTHPVTDPYRAIKILPATDANIDKVKAVIATAPAAK